jgi:outer membrane murein-binding lipoprotein Lpp
MARDVSGQPGTDPPEGVGDWIAEIARGRDVSEEELLSGLIEASDAETTAAPDRFESVRSDLAELENRIDSLDAGLDEKVSDVRERVIQIKREVDTKADAGHDHPELASEVDDLAGDMSALEEDINALEDRVETGMTDVTAGVEELGAEVDGLASEVNRKLNLLGAATVELRDQIRTIITAREEHAVLKTLQAEANRNGVRTASCESCSNGVQVGLLAEPRCPHCEKPFDAVEPKSWFFGSNVLKTGRPPALEGEIEATESDIDDIAEG